MNRILWNRRPTVGDGGGEIDEIVIDNCTVHVEQMSGRCWWIGVYLANGQEWTGNFTVGDDLGDNDYDDETVGPIMSFWEQESTVQWDADEEHGR